MTREQAKELLEDDRSEKLKEFSAKIVDKIYDDFENISCEGCIYKPKRPGIDCYAEECGSCKRFYADMYLTKEQEFD